MSQLFTFELAHDGYWAKIISLDVNKTNNNVISARLKTNKQTKKYSSSFSFWKEIANKTVTMRDSMSEVILEREVWRALNKNWVIDCMQVSCSKMYY